MKNPNTELITEYITKYPNLYKLSLAKLIFAENPGKFRDVDNIRSVIRYYYNQTGSPKSSYNKAFTPPSFFNQVYPTPDTPEPGIKLSSGKALIICDTHGHKHHPLLREFFQYGKAAGCDVVLLNGDIVDNEELSRWPQMQRFTPFNEEVELMRELLSDIADLFPKATKIYKKGNHEVWWDRELWKNPKLMSNDVIKERLKFEDVLTLPELGFKVVQDRGVVELGKLLVVHGHESKRGGVYIAKSTLEYYKRDVAFGHFHRIDFAKFDVYGGETIKSYGLPCSRDLHAKYTGINNQWTAGFAICEFTETDYQMDVYAVKGDKFKRV